MKLRLNIVLVSLTALFIVVVFTLPPYARYNEIAAGQKGGFNIHPGALGANRLFNSDNYRWTLERYRHRRN
jgi:hypothetical protein